MSASPPSHIQILVVGGGPAGSYAATVLAREGLGVAILEAAKFPRYHVGESLIPSVRHYLRFIDAEQKLVDYGFKHKPGSAIKFNQYKQEGYTDFVALGHSNSSWNVVRSEFDELLLDHARSCGVHVFEQTRVKCLQFSTSEPSRPLAAEWARSATDERGVTTFDYLVDATGRSGLMLTAYLKNRHFNASLKNIALWGYWRDVGTYGVGTAREGAPWFEALTDESGWAWFIPLHDGTTSIGVVMYQETYNTKTKALGSPSLEDRYRSLLPLAPNLSKLIGGGTLVSKSTAGGPPEPLVRSASDYSYSASEYAGNSFRVVGDAAAFIDPFFSSGVHLALTSAFSAATTICAALRGDCSEAEAVVWHTKRVSLSYTRFQLVVLSAYKQIRAQNVDVLSEVDEDNYDRAFAAIRPVIQGASDMGSRLSDAELGRALDFCAKFFNPTSAERYGDVPTELLDVTRPMVDPSALEHALLATCSKRVPVPDKDELEGRASELRMTVEKVNARRVMHREYALHNMEVEDITGYVVRLKRGSLGLVAVTVK
ncbi:FAD/NAD(P)-binding domain-containing protein [Leucogyrophana mollusca]|uniref:FAD/NAD(P)-binding domain-containing protein n=1 Tax=Leucogyrophana mollusca TaxID=85980 RepID=A0ACB8BNW1_9AGAM|nr:FAD/NAD(P)-binding domain-containing protein [Leucogyrophana mollusca]